MADVRSRCKERKSGTREHAAVGAVVHEVMGQWHGEAAGRGEEQQQQQQRQSDQLIAALHAYKDFRVTGRTHATLPCNASRSDYYRLFSSPLDQNSELEIRSDTLGIVDVMENDWSLDPNFGSEHNPR
uniref:Uncharacterized protein n=2 Tax=Oryza sativa TaxID=4530 RepID=Q6H4W4_ORYSJ|nr:hypothetical protein [Oryza sativa Japonica Group]BAD26235.1 hypothetical protein [Oryza sativa Japonica Group]